MEMLRRGSSSMPLVDRRHDSDNLSSKTLVFKFLLLVLCSVTAVRAVNISSVRRWPSYCSNEAPASVTVFQPCRTSVTSSNQRLVKCIYTGTETAENPVNYTTNDVPSRISNLNIQTDVLYIDYPDPGYHQTMTITWNLPEDGSFKYAKGFQLQVNYTDSAGNKIVIYRIFNISLSANLTLASTSQITFAYDCIKVEKDIDYEVTVYSLPRYKNNYVQKRIHTQNMNFTNLMVVDERNTLYWAAPMFVSTSSELNTIQVCFKPAPPEFKFSSYTLSVIDMQHGILNVKQQPDIVVQNMNYSVEQICREIARVSAGKYKVWLTPNGADIKCPCQQNNACHKCRATEVTSIDMTAAPFIPPARMTTMSTLNYTAVVGRIVLLDSTHMIVIIVGCIIAVALILFLVVIAFNWYCSGTSISPPESPDQKLYLPNIRQTVLLVYGRDNEAHLLVVSSFAAFLNECCQCDVLFDEYYRHGGSESISVIGLGEWLTRNYRRASCVIFIHSQGTYKQHRTWEKTGVLHELRTPSLLPDMFHVAHITFGHQKFVGQVETGHKQFFHVYFTQYATKHDVITGLRITPSYALMKQLEEFILNLHGQAKCTSHGQNDIKGLTEITYSMFSEKSKLLKEALDAAEHYHESHPDWFNEIYENPEPNPTTHLLPSNPNGPYNPPSVPDPVPMAFIEPDSTIVSVQPTFIPPAKMDSVLISLTDTAYSSGLENNNNSLDQPSAYPSSSSSSSSRSSPSSTTHPKIPISRMSTHSDPVHFAQPTAHIDYRYEDPYLSSCEMPMDSCEHFIPPASSDDCSMSSDVFREEMRNMCEEEEPQAY